MADPLTGLLSAEDESVVTDVLGREAPVSLKGQPTLPVGGAPVSGGAGPVAPGGTGVSPIASSTGGGGPAKAPGMSDAARAALAARFGLKLEDSAGKILASGPTAARNPETEQAFQEQRAGERADLSGAAGAGGELPSTLAAIRGGASPTTITGELSPEIAGLFGGASSAVPSTLASGAPLTNISGELSPAITSQLSSGAAEGAGAGVGGATGGGASGLSSAVGPALAGAGAAYAISQIATDPHLTDKQKAALSAAQAGAAAAAPFTFGLSEVAMMLQPYIGPTWDKMGLDPLYSDTFGVHPYDTKRQGAGKEATHELEAFGPAYTEAAKSGDPAQALKALSTPDQKVRADLRLPPDVAQQVGAGSFADMKPDQFNKLLDWFAEDPSRISSSLVGSGDVAYLPQKQAQAVANQAQANATQLLTYLTNRKVVQDALNASGAQPAPEPAPAKPPSTPAGGGPLGLAEIGLER